VSTTAAIKVVLVILSGLNRSLGSDTKIDQVFAVLAIGAGGMTVSRANDSYFWIIAEFSDTETATANRARTLATLVLGVPSIAWIVVLRNAAGLAF